ncbi:MAG: RNA polymerase sigma factor [Bacteroidetes bacterium]|nr:RNA polymerase sigma factor [Bacteroidota bacterium]
MDISHELIKRCIKRESKAEYELYKLTYSYLIGICLRYGRDKDMANEWLNTAFLKILTNIANYNQNLSFKAWIKRIMVNTLIDEYRKSKRDKEHISYVETYYDSYSFSEINEGLSRINCNQIHELVAKLPSACREVFNLFVIDGFSHKEIAEMLGISEGTSKWYLSEGRQKLKAQIEKLVYKTEIKQAS